MQKFSRFIYVFLVFSVAFLLNACSSTSTSNSSVPEWVLTPIQDDAQYLYGVGVGRSLAEAKQHGLKEIASKFSVSVNSDSLHKQAFHNGRADELFTQNINTEVKDIEFTHIEQKKAEVVDQQYYVLVAISREGFVADKKAKLNSIMNNIDAILKNVESKESIEQLYIYNKVQVEVAKAEPLLYLISVADSSFDLTTYTETFYAYSLREMELLASTRFFISSPQKLSPIARALSDSMQTHGFQISHSAKADAVIELQGDINRTEIFSSYNSRIDFSFLVKSNKGNVYSKKSYSLNGSSITSHEIAYDNAVKKFLTEVESRTDIYVLLGFEK